MSPKNYFKSIRMILASVFALGGGAIASQDALAVSLGIQLACATDYYAHCSAFSPDSARARSCMRAVGNNLSKRCVNALVAAGEVSAAEVARRHGAAKTASR